MISGFYSKHFKKKLFNKIIFFYSLLAVVSLVTLSVVVYQYYAKSSLLTSLIAQQKALEGIDRYLDQKLDASKTIVQQLYQENALIKDATYFLTNGYQPYLQHLLDNYTESTGSYLRDMNDYFAGQFAKDKDLQGIALYSENKRFVFQYKGVNDRRYYKLTDQETYFEPGWHDKASANEGDFAEWKKLNVNKYIYTIESPLYDPETLRNIGSILIDFDTNGIRRSLDYINMNGEEQILVLSSIGEVVFDSKNVWNGKKYPYMQEVINVPKSHLGQRIMLDEMAYVEVWKTNRLGYSVVGILPTSIVSQENKSLKQLLILVTAACIIIVVVLTYMIVLNFSRRTQDIVKAMKKVQDGNLKIRLPVRKEDELALISNSFNNMCEDLTQYINRFYKAELKQKNAELVAMQAQIKPHFLYNTLEVIRMRALSKGAHDVGDMIFILGSLFRNMIKDKTIITIGEEIENCRRYLELTRIRYQDKLQYHIAMDESLSGYGILKLTVQPIVENYLVHGLSLARKDNQISIELGLEEETIVIRIRDNGKGIEPDKLAEIHRDLERTGLDTYDSLGLMNVNERIKNFYGSAYGLTIESRVQLGTLVTLRLPMTRENGG